MGRQTYTILTCDRVSCGEEFKEREGTYREDIRYVDNLVFMVKRNGSGSMDSTMSKMLCPNCSKEFIKFMTDEPLNDY